MANLEESVMKKRLRSLFSGMLLTSSLIMGSQNPKNPFKPDFSASSQGKHPFADFTKGHEKLNPENVKNVFKDGHTQAKGATTVSDMLKKDHTLKVADMVQKPQTSSTLASVVPVAKYNEKIQDPTHDPVCRHSTTDADDHLRGGYIFEPTPQDNAELKAQAGRIILEAQHIARITETPLLKPSAKNAHVIVLNSAPVNTPEPAIPNNQPANPATPAKPSVAPISPEVKPQAQTPHNTGAHNPKPADQPSLWSRIKHNVGGMFQGNYPPSTVTQEDLAKKTANDMRGQDFERAARGMYTLRDPAREREIAYATQENFKKEGEILEALANPESARPEIIQEAIARGYKLPSMLKPLYPHARFADENEKPNNEVASPSMWSRWFPGESEERKQAKKETKIREDERKAKEKAEKIKDPAKYEQAKKDKKKADKEMARRNTIAQNESMITGNPIVYMVEKSKKGEPKKEAQPVSQPSATPANPSPEKNQQPAEIKKADEVKQKPKAVEASIKPQANVQPTVEKKDPVEVSQSEAPIKQTAAKPTNDLPTNAQQAARLPNPLPEIQLAALPEPALMPYIKKSVQVSEQSKLSVPNNSSASAQKNNSDSSSSSSNQDSSNNDSAYEPDNESYGSGNNVPFRESFFGRYAQRIAAWWPSKNVPAHAESKDTIVDFSNITFRQNLGTITHAYRLFTPEQIKYFATHPPIKTPQMNPQMWRPPELLQKMWRNFSNASTTEKAMMGISTVGLTALFYNGGALYAAGSYAVRLGLFNAYLRSAVESGELQTLEGHIMSEKAANILRPLIASEKIHTLEQMRKVLEIHGIEGGIQEGYAARHIMRMFGHGNVAIPATEEITQPIQAIATPNVIDIQAHGAKVAQQALEKFKDLPGALRKDGAIERLTRVGEKDFSQLNGSIYELETAFKIEKAGEKVVALGEKVLHRCPKTGNVIRPLEIDIETVTKVVECKNWDWSKMSAELQLEKIVKIQNSIGKLRDYGQSINKIPELYSKWPLPSSLKEWLIKNNIKFREG